MSEKKPPPAQNVGRKRMIDESTLSPEEARKLEERRAYNRQCAAQGKHLQPEYLIHKLSMLITVRGTLNIRSTMVLLLTYVSLRTCWHSSKTAEQRTGCILARKSPSVDTGKYRTQGHH